jgi:tetratricopeptide (TPR) repeat protein
MSMSRQSMQEAHDVTRLQRLCFEGRLREAITLADELLLGGATDLRVWYWKAAAQFQASEFDAAIATSEAALSVDPFFPEGWRGKALCLAEQGRNAEAIAFFEMALKCRPDDPVTLDELGKSLARLGRNREAADTFRRAVAISPRLATAWHHLAEVLWKEGELEEALTCIDICLSLDPADATAWNNRGANLIIKVTADPMSASTSSRPARVRLLHEALRSFDEALKRDPTNPIALQNRETLLGMVGRTVSRNEQTPTEPAGSVVGSMSPAEQRPE